MACQLIYTSAPRLLDAGHTGFGTVARSRNLGPALKTALERISTFGRARGTDAPGRIFAYRQITIGASAFHVLTSIADSGSDYTGRTNHTAQHLVLQGQDVDDLRLHTDFTPAGLVLALERQGFWKKEWTGTPSLMEDDAPWKPASPAPDASPSIWADLTGHAGNALHPLERQSQGLYLLLPPSSTPETALRLLDETSFQCPRQGWGLTWTTELDANYQTSDFACICVLQGSPEEKQAETGRRSILRLDRHLAPPAPKSPAHRSTIPDAPGTAIQDAPEIPGTPPPHPHRLSMKDAIRAQQKTDTPSKDGNDILEDDEEEEAPSHSSLRIWLASSISCILCLAAFYLYIRHTTDSTPPASSQPIALQDTPPVPTLLPAPASPVSSPARHGRSTLPADEHPPEMPEQAPAPSPAQRPPPRPLPAAPIGPPPPAAPIQQPQASSYAAVVKLGDPLPKYILGYLDKQGQFSQGSISIVPIGPDASPDIQETIVNTAHPVKLDKSGREYRFSHRNSGTFAPLFSLELSPEGTVSGTVPKNVILDMELNRDNQIMRLIIVPRMTATIPVAAKPPVPDSFLINSGELAAYPDAQSPSRYALKLRKTNFFPVSPILNYASNKQQPDSIIRLPRLRGIQDNALIIDPDAWKATPRQNGDFDIYSVSCQTAWPINDYLNQAFERIASHPLGKTTFSLSTLYGILSAIKSSNETQQSSEKYTEQYNRLLNDAAIDKFVSKTLNVKARFTAESTRKSEIAKPEGYSLVMQACRDYLGMQLQKEYRKLSAECEEIRLELDVITLHNNRLTWQFKETPKAQPAPTSRP